MTTLTQRSLSFPSAVEITNSYPSALSIPTFEVYRKGSNNKLVPNLVKAFLMKKVITKDDIDRSYLQLPDSSLWILCPELEVSYALDYSDSCICLVSYQVHRHGSFAVARLYEEDKAATNDITPDSSDYPTA